MGELFWLLSAVVGIQTPGFFIFGFQMGAVAVGLVLGESTLADKDRF